MRSTSRITLAWATLPTLEPRSNPYILQMERTIHTNQMLAQRKSHTSARIEPSTGSNPKYGRTVYPDRALPAESSLTSQIAGTEAE
jgi:hypothetical protein